MNNNTPRISRVIFHLKDGRKKYATHHGSMLQWTRKELEMLAFNTKLLGGGYFTADLKTHDYHLSALAAKHPRQRFIAVIAWSYEPITAPLDPAVIL